MKSISKILFLSRIGMASIAVILAILILSGCKTGAKEKPAPPPPSESLLFVVPYIGDETELRDPAPTPSRLANFEESVLGWNVPSEGVLRFPVNLREGARLAVRLGGIATEPVQLGEITAQIEFLSEREKNPIVLFQSGTEERIECFNRWLDIDISLSPCGAGKGEMEFKIDGDKVKNAQVKVHWGAPVIYYPEERRHKNVLLIGVDTLRHDSVTPYGENRDITPYLRALSETSTLFMQARSQCSWTLPSFASMVTGRLPSAIGANIYSGYVPDDATTIGEMLLPQGYATETVCSNTWLGNDQSGFQQGMEGLWYRYDASAQAVVGRARSFIASSTGRDWFCFIHLIDPHVPYTPPPTTRDKFTDPEYVGPYKNDFRAIEEWKSGLAKPEEKDIKQVKGLYEAEVANVDEALGDLFSFLSMSGLMDETLIIFSADHGEEFYEHGAFEHGHTMYDEIVHMPLIVRGQDFPEGSKIDSQVGNIDIIPTILKYFDLPLPENLGGIPLQDVVSEKGSGDRIIFGEGNNRGPDRKFAVKWPYKCVLDFVNGDIQLYDLEADPKETKNLAEEFPDIAQGLSKAMVAEMLPSENSYHMWIVAKPGEEARNFTGTLRIPGGIKSVNAFSIGPDDEVSTNGDTVTFRIKALKSNTEIDKHVIIVPNESSDTIIADVQVDGKIAPDRFYPYGTLTAEPSGHAEVKIEQFPLGSDLSTAMAFVPSSCFLWGVKGFTREEKRVQLSDEDIEQLKALGYVH